MKPVVINFNEVLENTAFADELSDIVFGAELALKYTGAAELSIDEVKRNIVRSALPPLSLNYEAMSGAAKSYFMTDSTADSGPLPSQPILADENSVSLPDPGGSSEQVYQDPDSGGYNTEISGEYEQTADNNAETSGAYEQAADNDRYEIYDDGSYSDDGLSLDYSFDPQNISIGE